MMKLKKKTELAMNFEVKIKEEIPTVYCP